MTINKKLKTKKRKLKLKRTKVLYGGSGQPKEIKTKKVVKTPEPAPNPTKFKIKVPKISGSVNMPGVGSAKTSFGPNSVKVKGKIPGIGSVNINSTKFKVPSTLPSVSKEKATTQIAAALGEGGKKTGLLNSLAKKAASMAFTFEQKLEAARAARNANAVASGISPGQDKQKSASISSMIASAAAIAKQKFGGVDLQKIPFGEIQKQLKELGLPPIPDYIEKMIIDAPTQQEKTQIMSAFLSTQQNVPETTKADILEKLPNMDSIQQAPSAAKGAIAGMLGQTKLPKMPSLFSALSIAKKSGALGALT